MAKNKTEETSHSVEAYIEAIADPKRQTDFSALVSIFKTQTGLEPAMWGSSIVGFGSYSYKYESGHEGTAPLVGLSCRANAHTLYVSSAFEERERLLAQLGKHKTAKACIYINKLEDVEKQVLADLVKAAFEHAKSAHSN